MKAKMKRSLIFSLIELAGYAGVVTLYFFLVLAFLGGWLQHLFESERKLYAVVALGLISGQGFLLELITRPLLSVFKSRVEDR
jgi:NADH:ubiquinone oxidoreductase subunit H